MCQQLNWLNPLKSCLEIPFFSPGGPATLEERGFKEITSEGASRARQVNGDSFKLPKVESHQQFRQGLSRAIDGSTRSKLEDDK